MGSQINHNLLRANPKNENFKGKYESNGVISNYLVRSYFKSVEKLISKIDIDTAHEIGAGEGFSTQRLHKLVNRLTASEYVDHLVKKASERNTNLTIFQESVYELKMKDNSVDLVFLLEVLEHLDYPKLALEQIKKITKSYLILGVPREPLWRILNMCRFKYLKAFGNTPGHLNHWSKKAIIKFVETNFGQVIAVKTPLPWTIILAKK